MRLLRDRPYALNTSSQPHNRLPPFSFASRTSSYIRTRMQATNGRAVSSSRPFSVRVVCWVSPWPRELVLLGLVGAHSRCQINIPMNACSPVWLALTFSWNRSQLSSAECLQCNLIPMLSARPRSKHLSDPGSADDSVRGQTAARWNKLKRRSS